MRAARAAIWRRAASAAAALVCAGAALAEPPPGERSESEYPRDFAPAPLRYEPYAPPPLGVARRPVQLDAKTLAQLALEQNAEVLYARLQSRISEQAAEAEGGLYLPVAYANARREGRHRQRTVEERLTAALGGISRLDERVLAGEAGVRVRAFTGAEVALSWRSNQRRSNVIASASSFSPSDSESTGALVLTLRQPLLRGAGREVVETDLRVARYEREIGAWQFRQQTLRIASDALSAYWQLWRARGTQGLRSAALANAQETVDDVRVRVDGGRLGPAALDEAQAVMAARRAELARGQQSVLDAEARVRVLLDLPAQDGDWALSGGEFEPTPEPALSTLAERLPDAEAAWPPLRVAQLKREQADARLRLAYSKKLPALDVQASYSSNSLTYGPLDAALKATQGRNPDWTIGVAVEVPIGGDRRAQAEYRAQALRVEQSQLEIHSVRQALASDLFNRAGQLGELGRELVQLRGELQAREALEAGVRQQFDAGVSPRSRLLRLQADVLDARLRLIDGASRWALARVALQLADGSLLNANDIQINE